MLRKLDFRPVLVCSGLALLVGCGSGVDGGPGDDPGVADAIADAANVVRSSTGSGAPSGAHYNLNILGKPNNIDVDMTDNSGHRIFVPLSGTTKINLSEGPFAVLDANGTDGSAAFQLPSPDPDGDGITTYSVFVRALGKPGGSSTMTTCATDPTTLEEYCSIYQSVQVRNTGKSTFTNVSKQLLYLYVDLDGDGVVERYPLFSSTLEDYYWAYDNNNLRLLQMRFYEVPTNVN